MHSSPLAYLFIKLETYEKLRSLNRNENFLSMNENDLVMYMLDKLSDEINYNRLSTNNSQSSSCHTPPLSADSISYKIEKTHVVKPSANIQENPISLVKESLPNPSLSQRRPSIDDSISRPKQPGQYKCSCGDSFSLLPLFLQHNFKCPSSKQPRVKLESITAASNKRHSTDNRSDLSEPTAKKRSTNSCDNCHRTFRTSSTLCLHDCQRRRASDHSEVDLSQSLQPIDTAAKPPPEPDNPSPIADLSSQEHAYVIQSLPKSLSTFTCHCLVEFTDFSEYCRHTGQCGKPSEHDHSLASLGSRSSPLKVQPNSVGKFDCRDCPKSFTSILSLRQHRDGMHRPLPKYVCKLCGKGYRWCTSFHYHKKKCSRASQ